MSADWAELARDTRADWAELAPDPIDAREDQVGQREAQIEQMIADLSAERREMDARIVEVVASLKPAAALAADAAVSASLGHVAAVVTASIGQVEASARDARRTEGEALVELLTGFADSLAARWAEVAPSVTVEAAAAPDLTPFALAVRQGIERIRLEPAQVSVDVSAIAGAITKMADSLNARVQAVEALAQQILAQLRAPRRAAKIRFSDGREATISEIA